MVGTVVVVAVEAEVVAGRLMAMPLMLLLGRAVIPTCMPMLMGMAILRCQQHLASSCHPLALGQLRL